MVKHKKLTKSEIAEEDRKEMEKLKKNERAQPHKRDASRSSHLSNVSHAKDESMLSDTKSVQSDVAERWVEMDQEDKALAITGRPNGLTFSAFIIQEFPQRVQRHDFVEQIVRQCFDFFDGHPERQREIVAAADKAARIDEERFLANTCSEYEMPKFEMAIHAPDYE